MPGGRLWRRDPRAAAKPRAGRRNVYGSDHAKTLIPMNDLGLRLTDSDRAAGRRSHYWRKHWRCQHSFGLKHTNTLTIMGNLSSTYAKAGRANEPVSLAEEALAGYEQTDDTRHQLETRHQLGFAYSQAQMWDQAVPFLKDTLELDVQELGPEHDQTLITIWQLGIACHGSGQIDMAISYLEDAFEMHKRSFVQALLKLSAMACVKRAYPAF